MLSLADEVDTPQFTPAEIAATVYHLMGLDLEMFLPAQLGRVVPLVDNNAQPVREMLA